MDLIYDLHPTLVELLVGRREKSKLFWLELSVLLVCILAAIGVAPGKHKKILPIRTCTRVKEICVSSYNRNNDSQNYFGLKFAILEDCANSNGTLYGGYLN